LFDILLLLLLSVPVQVIVWNDSSPVINDLQHYPFQEPGTRLQLPGYPDPVFTFT